MSFETRHIFNPVAPDSTRLVSWIHLGDLHMVRSGEQNHRDLIAIVEEINRNFAGKGISFVYLPGDIADDGSPGAYAVVRECLDRLEIPWCGIVGDHDVYEKSFENFRHAIDASLYSAFTVGDVRFFRLNTFSEPRPDSFVVDDEQLDWLERELEQSGALRPVVLMHCYPSDLKRGGEQLLSLLHRYRVRFVDMGHTHYNELSNDGKTLYGATRSTGQIEEGPVGYSVVSLDGDVVSWHFVELGTQMFASITSPGDERLLTEAIATRLPSGQPVEVRVRVWGARKVETVELTCSGVAVDLDSTGEWFWTATVPGELLTGGVHEVVARFEDKAGEVAEDRIRLAIGAEAVSLRERSAVDHENAIGEWTDRYVLGTQLGPNKNGKKW